ncbi:MAG TPA: winged helix-turn-helix domain-containing protein [Gammaproteobacteria bacterium]|nr:winged helix-turn-helix domain-containing protein [Gammaproteobacteria bacterium]
MEQAADQEQFEFSDFRFDPASGELHGRGTVQKLRAQVARVLSLLLERPGIVVDREMLRRTLWPDKRVVLFEVSIAATIRELRRALGDNAKSPRYIETLPRRGYRFIAPVTQVSWPLGATTNGPVAPAGRRPPAAWLRSGRLLLILSLWLVFEGSVSIESTPSMQAAADATLTFHIEAFAADNQAALLLRRVVRDELPAYLAAALPSDVRILAGDGGPVADAKRPAAMGHQAVLLKGGIRIDGDALVISARGLAAGDGRRLWSGQYRMPAEDPALAGREAAARIAGAILDDLAPALLDTMSAPPPEPALEPYRQAMAQMQRPSVESADAAARLFQDAIDAAPEFAAAHAGLADALITWPGPPKTPERVRRARAAATRALELAPDHPVAHRVLGDIHLFQDRAWTSAAERLTRAAQLAPADARIRHSLASWLSARGRHRDALMEIELARALDPASIAISFDVMAFHFHARDFAGTLEAARRLALLWPGNRASDRFSVLSYQAMGDLAAAQRIAWRDLAQRGVVADGPRPKAADAAHGLEAYWAGTAQALEQAATVTWIDPAQLAVTFAHAGRTREALQTIETATGEQYFSYLVPYLGVTPALDPLRGHLQFEQVLRSLGQAGQSEFYANGAQNGSVTQH